MRRSLAGIEGHHRPTKATGLVIDAMPKTSKAIALARATKVIAGITAHFSPRATERVAGKLYTREELIDAFALYIEAVNEVGRARTALTAAVAKERASARRARSVLASLKLYVAGRLGDHSLAWTDFGWPVPKKPGPKTVASKLAGVRKARATRASR